MSGRLMLEPEVAKLLLIGTMSEPKIFKKMDKTLNFILLCDCY